MIKPRKLEKGNTIGIIAPANFANLDRLEEGLSTLKYLGYKTIAGVSCRQEWYNFAGSDKVRADDINKMFADNSVDAILCLRGGYGSCRLIDYIDFDIIASNPKLFIGYSDVTTLHCAFNKICSLITIHGPMLVSNLVNNSNTYMMEQFFNTVEGNTGVLKIPDGRNVEQIIHGKCQGELTGGNLALLTASLGTNYSIDAKDKILFIEDINEYTYQIDKMMFQLKYAGIFDKCKGVVIGDFQNCNKEKGCDFSLREMFEMFFKDFNKPVIYNFPAGHCSQTQTLALGGKYDLNAAGDNCYLKLLESPVS